MCSLGRLLLLTTGFVGRLAGGSRTGMVGTVDLGSGVSAEDHVALALSAHTWQDEQIPICKIIALNHPK